LGAPAAKDAESVIEFQLTEKWIQQNLLTFNFGEKEVSKI
jgi:hypothetical protein